MQADKHLLFGLLALQNNFLSRDQLVTAFCVWVADKKRSLANVLVEQGALSQALAELLLHLTDQHVAQHQSDVQQSLLAIESASSACAALSRIEDPELRISVAPLLQPRAGDPYSTRLSSATQSTGRFELRRPLGRGGLGIVSIALDRELNREVALKEIRADRAHEDAMRRRFVTEAEVTGNLEHPGIVPVYALGSHEDGRPYYAMRFVRGDNLTIHIREFHERVGQGQTEYDGATLRELLRRFLDVCDAVGYAHSRGVLHRDLKPGNIMLGKFGETLVVDWGLAKAQGRSGDPSSTQEPVTPQLAESDKTGMGSVVGTLAYAPPEQIDGNLSLIDARSDVYGLGSILYELLAGTHPVSGLEPEEAIPSIRRGLLPSPKARQPKVPHALDRICMKAMAADQNARYSSAQELMKDIANWLDDEPITVCPEGWGDRMRRRFRKHKQATVTAFVSLVAICLVLAASLALVNSARSAANAARYVAMQETARANEQFQNAERQRSRGDLYFRQARDAVDRFLSTVSNDSLLAQPTFLPLRRTLLTEALGYYQEFRNRSEGDTRLAAEQLMATNRNLAQIQLALGELAQALESIEQATKDMARLGASGSLNQEVTLEKAKILKELGRFAEARQLIEADFKKAQALQTTTLSELQLAANRCELMGGLAHAQLDRSTTESAFKRELELRTSVVQQDSAAGNIIRLAQAHSNLAGEYAEQRQFGTAISNYQRAQVLLEPLMSQDNIDAEAALDHVHHNLAICYRATSDKQSAAEHYDAVIALRRRRVDKSLVPGPTADLIKSLADAADQWHSMKQTDTARKVAQQAVELAEALTHNFASVVDYQVLFADALHRHAVLLEDKDRALSELQRAEQIYNEAIESQQIRQGVKLQFVELLKSIAKVHRQHGQVEETFTAMERACRYADQLAADFPQDLQIQTVAVSQTNLHGTFLVEKRQYARAIAPLSKAVEGYALLLQQSPDSQDLNFRLANSRVLLVRSLVGEKQFANARSYLDPLLEQLVSPGEAESPEMAQVHLQALAQLGNVLLAEGQPFEAAKASAERLKIVKQDPQTTLNVLQMTARCATSAADEPELQRKLAELCLEQLSSLRDMGFKDVAKIRALEELKAFVELPEFDEALKAMEQTK